MVWGAVASWNGKTKSAAEIDLNTFARGLYEYWDQRPPGLVELRGFQFGEISKQIQASPPKRSKLFSLEVLVHDGEGEGARFTVKIRKRTLQAMGAANVHVARQAFDYILELLRTAPFKPDQAECSPGVLTVDLGDVECSVTCFASFDTGFSECDHRGIDQLKLKHAVETQPVWTFRQHTVQLCIKEQQCPGVSLLIDMSRGDPFNVEVHKTGKVQLKGVKKRSLDDAYTFTSGLLTELYPCIRTAPGGGLTPTRKNRKRRSPEVA